jgi:transposase
MATYRAFDPSCETGGRKRTADVREVVNGIVYVLSTGCQWRYLPKDLPPKSTVYRYFDLWNYDGTLEAIHHTLYVKCREAEEREASPTRIFGSPSSKRPAVGSRPTRSRCRASSRCLNVRRAGQWRQIQEKAQDYSVGLKPQIPTPKSAQPSRAPARVAFGYLVRVCPKSLSRTTELSHPADIQDRDGGIMLLSTLFGMFPFLQKLFADSAPFGMIHRQPEREERRKRGACMDPRGYDAGKKIKGKKRHLLVDTLGLLLHAVVLCGQV